MASNSFMPALAAALALWTVLVPAPTHAAQCAENRDFFQSLPTVIGREDQSARFGYVLKCDTVFVRKGVTTVVHPGAMLFFANPSLNSVIKVEGTLVIKGSKNSYVYLSGSLDTTKTGSREPGSKPWGGIEVAEGGKLEMEFAGVMRAPTPITAFSPKVRIVNSFFKGSSGIILQDGNLMPMEVSWHAINDLDLEKGTGDAKAAPVAQEKSGDGLSKEEKAALLDKKPQGFWTMKRVAGGAAALAVVAAGALYLGSGEEGGPPPTNPNTEKTDPRDRIGDVPLPVQ